MKRFGVFTHFFCSHPHLWELHVPDHTKVDRTAFGFANARRLAPARRTGRTGEGATRRWAPRSPLSRTRAHAVRALGTALGGRQVAGVEQGAAPAHLLPGVWCEHLAGGIAQAPQLPPPLPPCCFRVTCFVPGSSSHYLVVLQWSGYGIL